MVDGSLCESCCRPRVFEIEMHTECHIQLTRGRGRWATPGRDILTTSSSAQAEIMMQEVTESMSLPTIKERFAGPDIKAVCPSMFPLDD